MSPFMRLLAVPALLLGLVPVAGAHAHPGQAKLVHQVVAATGKSAAQLNALLDGAHKQQSILDAMNRPAESKSWKEYRPIFMTQTRIDDGVAFYRQHQKLLERIGAQYNVDPAYLVAILGVETNYGRITGHYKVLDALVTLGFYYPSRGKFFRAQLKTLLELPRDKLGGPLDSLTGSYAGAQGWPQFMPDSIRAFGVDQNHDGRIDLHDSLPDILGSVANYFHAHGWAPHQPVSARVQVDADAHPVSAKGSKPRQPLEQFEAWGYAPARHINPGLPSTLLSLDGADGPQHWLTFHNFYVITRYNRSPMYAMVVHQLAEAITAANQHGADTAQQAP